MSIRAVFRWEFTEQSVTHREYAEAELHQYGRPSDPRHMLQIYLVRDEMPQPREGDIIDPEVRVGKRVYVGSYTNPKQCRLLADLCAVAAQDYAYNFIYNTLQDNPDKVRRFGNDWLTDLMTREQD